ncbi:hypothetical protein IFM89_010955 [Coptis chinensis]|uniref:TF-B3 domain-containing protein n=1 Tax=Coptis chinensis TaxID=261450 RepID=A0A835ILW2_9MAGN|nr:hypothetical protein IFM89_010955 [Coptis chinensis]
MKVLPIHERHLRAEAFVPPKGKDIAMEASKALKLKHPSFEVAMKSQYVKHGFLPLPKHFTRKYLRGMFNYVTLKLSDEREWEIKCIFGEGRCRFSQGWSEVMRETNMKEGDLCVFELIKKNAGVFRVYVCHELED